MKTFARVFIIISILPLFLLATLKVYASDITSSWLDTTSLPYLLASHVAFSLNEKPYVLGGSASTGQSHPDVISSIPSTSGALGLWIFNSTFPTAPIFHSVVTSSKGVYILGGREENPGSLNDFVNKVFFNNVDSGGNLTGWTAQNSLPNNLGLGAAAISGNRIFFSGGFNNSIVSKKVYSAPINPDGSLGVWIEAGEMPEGRLGHGMIEYNGNLIILGGSANGPAFDTVYKASVNPNGTISSWSLLPSLPEPLYRASFVKAGGQILVIGGYNAGLGSRDTVYYTTVHTDGTIGPWQLSANHLPATVHGASATVAGNYLYLAGGYRTQTDQYLNSVYVTKLGNSNDTSLNVPLIKQTDSLWKDLEYDSAHVWAPPLPITIGRWGCALTSAVMVFRYHGITKLPDGSDLTPDTLNKWLKNEKDGYVETGWVNWIKLSALAKKAKSQNPSFLYDTLEFSSKGYNTDSLKNDLTNNIPVILAEPGHFIVAKGTSGSTFAINDPGFNRDFLTDYSSTFSAQKRFIPANSDLSYIMLFSKEDIVIRVKDALGNLIGEYTKEQKISSLDGDGYNSPQDLNVYYVPKPEGGNYSVEISSVSSKKYSLGGYLYDLDGNVKTFSFNGLVSSGNSDYYTIIFDKNQSDNSDFITTSSFNSLLVDLDSLYSLGGFKNYGLYNAFKVKLAQAMNLQTKNPSGAKVILSSLIAQLDALRGKNISEDTYLILKPQIESLLNSI